MRIQDIAEVINGEIIYEDTSKKAKVERAFASDLMSDVLTLDTHSLMLITGLANMQTIRTAEMADITNILFVRNKKITDDMLQLAKKEGINIIQCNKSMFATCGELFKSGLAPVY